MTVAMITGKCEICNTQIVPGATQAKFNRNKGLHMRAAHGIAGRHAQRRGRPKLDLNGASAQNLLREMTPAEKRMLSPTERKERLRLKKAQWWAEHRSKRAKAKQLFSPEPQPQQSNQAVPCKLSECPCCGTRFYMIRGES